MELLYPGVNWSDAVISPLTLAIKSDMVITH